MTRTVLGIDPGTRRVGVAVSDANGTMAFPLTVLERREGDSYLDELAELARMREANEIVVGLPTRLDGTEGPEAAEALRIAGILRKKLDLPVHMLDERFTTRIAQGALQRSNVSSKKQRPVVDKIAATVLLQSYLDAHPVPKDRQEDGGPDRESS
ncbi:MAG TPA: Holliday junction resolvase RuvX [Actinomycetota bacterium]|nr:Holliday junction resolvase RuvX [Actinomycetota bacterium]